MRNWRKKTAKNLSDAFTVNMYNDTIMISLDSRSIDNVSLDVIGTVEFGQNMIISPSI